MGNSRQGLGRVKAFSVLRWNRKSLKVMGWWSVCPCLTQRRVEKEGIVKVRVLTRWRLLTVEFKSIDDVEIEM